MRPSALLVPPAGHRIDVFGQLGAEFNRSVARRGVGYLGLIAAAGLGVIVVRLLRDGREFAVWGVESEVKSDATAAAGEIPRAIAGLTRSTIRGYYRRLGVMVLGGTLVAAVGGGAVLISISGFTQIRCVGPHVHRHRVPRSGGTRSGARPLDRPPWRCGLHPGLRRRRGPGGRGGDRPGRCTARPRHQNRELRQADAEIAASMESALEPGDSVFQFPWVAFPGGVTDRGLPPYVDLGPWASGSDRLAYSAGAIQGRAATGRRPGRPRSPTSWRRAWLRPGSTCCTWTVGPQRPRQRSRRHARERRSPRRWSVRG